MKDYDENKESSYLKYQGINNLRRQTTSEKLASCGLEWIDEII